MEKALLEIWHIKLMYSFTQEIFPHNVAVLICILHFVWKLRHNQHLLILSIPFQKARKHNYSIFFPVKEWLKKHTIKLWLTSIKRPKLLLTVSIYDSQTTPRLWGDQTETKSRTTTWLHYFELLLTVLLVGCSQEHTQSRTCWRTVVAEIQQSQKQRLGTLCFQVYLLLIQSANTPCPSPVANLLF